MKFAYLFLVLSLVFTGFFPESYAVSPEMSTAAISKIDGDGIAKVRRRTGIESVAGVNQELFAGDRISTDARSVVEIMLSDGTMVRIGLNSEYRLESVEKKNGIFSWVFGLAKGSIRAMVEKNPKKDMVKFRVNTPVGTMGVRGTELVLEHNEKNKLTTLGVIEGRVEFGAKGCELKRKCIEVKTGETASIGAGQAEQPVAKPSGMASLLLMNDSQGGKDSSMNPATDEERLARAALFTDMKNADNLKNNTRGLQAKDTGDVDKILKEASEAMAAAQDKLIGRTKQDREAIEKAIKDGSYSDRLKLAEKFDDLRDGSDGKGKDRETENLSANTVNKKLKAADAILKSKKMQTALEKRAAKSGDLIEAKLAAAQATLKEERNKSEISKAKTATSTSTQSSTSTKTATSVSNSTITDSRLSQTQVQDADDGEEENKKVKDATELLDSRLTDAILKDETKETDFQRYAYQVKKCILFVCWTDTVVGYGVTSTENTKIERRSGVCWETKKNCDRKLIPCDLKSGKSCKPTFTSYNCKESKRQVACPATGNSTFNGGFGNER